MLVVNVPGGTEVARRAAVDPLAPLDTVITEDVEAVVDAVDITIL